MTKAEHETHINFDYEREEVIIYTTRSGEKNGVLRRLPEDVAMVTATVNDGREIAWTIRIPENYARTARQITVGPSKGKRLAKDDKRASSEAV
jgi:hypothetical protein